MADDVITKAEFSRELGLSRARVTQLCKIGLPVRPDGKLNRMQALKWVKANVDPSRGGWRGDMRPRKKAKARDADTGKELELDIPKDARSCDYQSLSEYWRGATDMVNALRRPGNIRCIAEMVIAHGCTAAQAYGVAKMYGFLLAFWMGDVVSARLGKEDPQVIQLFDMEPNWSEIARIAGEPVAVEAWEKESRWRMEEWTARAQIERPKHLRADFGYVANNGAPT